MGMTGGGDTAFTFKMLIFSMAIMILLPMFITILCPANLGTADQDEVLNGYEQMTGQSADPKVSVWPLTGIYTPYTGGTKYGYTEDGWLFGSEIKSYTPTQYRDTLQSYTVYKDKEGVYRYWQNSQDYDADMGTGHKGVDGTYPGDLYTSVNFDASQKSSIFFMESSRHETDDGFFYYDYDGYRLSFQPISNYTALDADGNRKPVIATTTSLSLIWYQFYNQSGVSGNLILSGSSSGLAYLNAAQILAAFNSTNNTASFDMVFNGITMNIIIKIDSYYTYNGYSVEDCYNNGWWSIMVTSLSADASAYTGTDYSLNPMKILETMIDLFTFNYSQYNIAPWLGAICSLFFAIPLYASLIAICLDHAYLWIFVGLLGAVQALSSLSLFG